MAQRGHGLPSTAAAVPVWVPASCVLEKGPQDKLLRWSFQLRFVFLFATWTSHLPASRSGEGEVCFHGRSGVRKRHARQLDPAQRWGRALSWGVDQGWAPRLGLRGGGCLVARMSPVNQARPPWREPGSSYGAVRTAIPVIPGLLAGRSQAAPFSPQNLAELNPPLVCVQSLGCSFHMIGPGALWVPTGKDLAGGRPLRAGGGRRGPFLLHPTPCAHGDSFGASLPDHRQYPHGTCEFRTKNSTWHRASHRHRKTESTVLLT